MRNLLPMVLFSFLMVIFTTIGFAQIADSPIRPLEASSTAPLNGCEFPSSRLSQDNHHTQIITAEKLLSWDGTSKTFPKVERNILNWAKQEYPGITLEFKSSMGGSGWNPFCNLSITLKGPRSEVHDFAWCLSNESPSHGKLKRTSHFSWAATPKELAQRCEMVKRIAKELYPEITCTVSSKTFFTGVQMWVTAEGPRKPVNGFLGYLSEP